MRRRVRHRVECTCVGGSSGHANRAEYQSGPIGQPSAHPAASLGISSPTPGPAGCRNLVMCETSSMVGKCRAIATARCLTAIGRLSSRAISIKKPPAQRSALVRSCGIVMARLTKGCTKPACTRTVSQTAIVAWSTSSRIRARPRALLTRREKTTGLVFLFSL